MRGVTESRLGAVLRAIPGTPRVVVSGNFGTPWAALRLLDNAISEYRLFVLNAQTGIPDRDGVALESPFVGPGMRGSQHLRYFPCRLSLVPDLLKEALAPDVVLLHASTPLDGTVSLGIEVNVLPAAIEAARARGGLVVAQLNPRMPYTYGDAVLPESDIDFAIEVDEPLPSPEPRPAEVFERIGEQVAGLVPEAATLQLDPGTPLTASFAFGSAELYDWLDCNARIRMLRTEKTNDPAIIARQPRMVSINGALQVDLFAQANAARVHGAIYSGFGGQTDFVVGALHSPGGRAIIALPSWHPKAGVSTVVPRLAGPVTSFQHSFIVSEQGTAPIWGHDAASQADQIVGKVAHPSVRDDLRRSALSLGFGSL